MVATFHLHYLGHRIKYENLEVGNTTQQLLLTTRPWRSIEFIELFLCWFILLIYNTGIYICVYIYIYIYVYIYIFIKLAILILFLLSSALMFFLHYMLNILRYKKMFCEIDESILHSTIHQVMWYFWTFIVNPFSLLWSIFFSRKLCFLWSPCLLLITLTISLDTSGKLTMCVFLKTTYPSWIILSILLDELSLVDWLLKSRWWIFLK